MSMLFCANLCAILLGVSVTTGKMEVTATQKSLGQVAGILGLLQGTAWMVISIICIVLYNDGLTLRSIPTSYMESWNEGIYVQFLSKDLIDVVGYVATPTLITVFAWIYLLMSTVWIVVSLLKLIAIHNNSVKIPAIFKTWGCVTSAIFAIDLILAILIGVDFNKCLTSSSNLPYSPIENLAHEEMCTTIFIPVLVIVARGFVLMVVNLIFSVLTLRIGKQLGNEKKAARSAAGITSNLYGNDPNAGNTIPRATVPSSRYGPPNSGGGGPSRNQPYYGANNNSYPDVYSQNPPQQNWNSSNMRNNGYNGRSQPAGFKYPTHQNQGRY